MDDALTNKNDAKANLPPLKGREQDAVNAYLEAPDAMGRTAYVAKKIGLSTRQTQKILKRAQVIAHVRARESAIQQHVEEKQLVTAEYVINKLKETVDASLKEVPICAPFEGIVGHRAVDPKGAVMALRALGDYLGMFREEDKAESNTFNIIIHTDPKPAEPKQAGQVIDAEVQHVGS